MKKKKKKPLKKKKTKRKTQKLDPNVEEVYEKTITFICPVRGRVTQKVKVKKYKSFQVEQKNILKESGDDPISRIEEAETLEQFSIGDNDGENPA